MAQLAKTFYPYDPLPAADLNTLVSFMNGIASGTNLEPNAVDTSAVKDKAITAQKIDFETLLLGQISPVTSAQNGISSTPTDITGTNLVITIPSGAEVRFTWSIPALSISSGDRANISLREGSTVYKEWLIARGTPLGSSASGQSTLVGLSGSHTFKLVFYVDVGSGVVGTNANATRSVEFWAEIVG